MDNKFSRLSAEKIHELANEKIAENEKNSASALSVNSIPLRFSAEVQQLCSLAESDQNSAMELLKLLAKSLRARSLPPDMLADFVADAIDVAAAKSVSYQARALTDELHLTTQARRPANSWLVVGHAVHFLVASGKSRTKANVQVAVQYGVDEGTALKYHKQFMAAKQKHDDIE